MSEPVNNNDPNQQPDAGSLGNQTEPAAPSAPSTAAPSAPSTAAPSAQPRPAQPQQPPVSRHARIFDSILNMVGGGTQYTNVTDPETGAVTRTPIQQSRGQLGRNVLAAALAGMVAGADARDKEGRHDPMKAAAMGYEAGGQPMAKKVGELQQASDEDISRRQMTIKNNMEIVKQQVMSAHQQHVDLQETAIRNQNGILADAEQYDKNLSAADVNDVTKKAILARGLDYNAALAKLKGQWSNNSVFVDGYQDVMNPDTKVMEVHPTYAILNSAIPLRMNADQAKEFARFQPAYQNAYDASGGNLTVSLHKYASDMNTLNSLEQSEAFFKRVQDQIGAKDVPDFASVVREGGQPVLNAVHDVQVALGQGGDATDALKRLAASGGGSLLLQKMGISNQQVDDLWNKKIAAQKLAEAGADPKKNPADPALVTSFRTDVKKNYPGLNAGQVDSLAKQLGAHPTQQTFKEVQETAEKYDAANTSRAQKGTEMSDKDQQTMWKTGIAPTSHERLSLDNAPDEFLVDTATGLPIPTSMVTTKKPTMQESNRADFAKSAIHSLDKLNELISSNEAKFGPVTGPIDKWMASHGLSDQYQQAALNYLTFAQSASTGAHVGGRFNVPIMDKMGTTVSVNMDKDQLKGATDSIEDIMQQYVDQGGRFSVAQYRALPQKEKDRLRGMNQPTPGAQPRVVPAGAVAGRDKSGNIIGYKTPDGKVVTF